MRGWRALILAGVGLTAALPAAAADAVTVGLGGRLREYFFVADQKSAPAEKLNAVGQFNEALIAVEAKTTLADGTTIRAYGRYDIANSNAQNLNEAFVDIGTGVGHFRVGTNFDTNTMIIGDPVPEAFLSVDEELIGDALRPRTGITQRDALTFKRFVENAQGVSYQTPSLYGFRAGITYHPTADTITGTIDGRVHTRNAVDATAVYEGDFPGGTYRVSGGYFTVDAPNGLFVPRVKSTTTAWNIAAGLTYGGWELSGAYLDTSPADGFKETAWGVGLLYAIDRWRFSTDFRHATRLPALGATLRERENRAQLQSAYKLAPGFSVGLAGFYADQRDAAGITYDSKGLVGGIKLDF
jgi:predicted porin